MEYIAVIVGLVISICISIYKGNSKNKELSNTKDRVDAIEKVLENYEFKQKK